jgi:hypothetical protein
MQQDSVADTQFARAFGIAVCDVKLYRNTSDIVWE